MEELARHARQQQRAFFEQGFLNLTVEQRHVFDTVKAAVDDPSRDRGRLCFLNAPGGTGKTYTYAVIMAYYRAQGKIVLPVASSGIAAQLLEGGKTAHSRFKIPVQGLSGSSTCKIHKHTPLADLIKASSLIIWDEAPMTHRYVWVCRVLATRDLGSTCMALCCPDIASRH